jgi:CRISPR-associated protein Cas1
MSTIYIDRSGSRMSVQNGVLSIDTPDQARAQRVPLKFIDRIVLRADTQLGSNTLCALAGAGINLIALGGRDGQKIAQIAGAGHNDARRRWQQAVVLSHVNHCTQLALGIIHAKVKRQHAALCEIAKHRPDIRKQLHDGQRGLDSILQTLGEQNTRAHHTLDQLRGLEGAAAAMYFDAYFKAFAPSLGASHRNRRPPKDPVNAVLSLAYTMLYAQASSACWSAGLDPALGALHTISHARAALACDIMEPLRPTVDVWIWQQFRSGELRGEHFGHDGAGACLLGKAGRAHFYQAWEAQAHHHQRALRGYARALAKAIVSMPTSTHWQHLTDVHFTSPQSN